MLWLILESLVLLVGASRWVYVELAWQEERSRSTWAAESAQQFEDGRGTTPAGPAAVARTCYLIFVIFQR